MYIFVNIMLLSYWIDHNKWYSDVFKILCIPTGDTIDILGRTDHVFTHVRHALLTLCHI